MRTTNLAQVVLTMIALMCSCQKAQKISVLNLYNNIDSLKVSINCGNSTVFDLLVKRSLTGNDNIYSKIVEHKCKNDLLVVEIPAYNVCDSVQIQKDADEIWIRIGNTVDEATMRQSMVAVESNGKVRGDYVVPTLTFSQR